jgi:hypothetical protein
MKVWQPGTAAAERIPMTAIICSIGMNPPLFPTLMAAPPQGLNEKNPAFLNVFMIKMTTAS